MIFRRHANRARFSLFFVLSLLSLSCSPLTGDSRNSPKSPEVETDSKETKADLPLRLLQAEEIPSLVDDLNFANIDLALERQITRFNEKNLSGSFKAGGKTYQRTQLRESLIEFQSLVRHFKACLTSQGNIQQTLSCEAKLQQVISQRFDILAPDLKPGDPRFGEPEPAFFTAYYTPTLEVTSEDDTKHRFAIYNRPKDPKLARLSRQEIDFHGRLNGHGLELGFSDDLFEVYLLHIQGGGKLVFNDFGKVKTKYISYSGANGLPYKAIGKYMLEKGYISDTLIPFQKSYLDSHPEQWEEIYSSCPNYVFFEETDSSPWGVDMVPLTDNRSLATDRVLYPEKGLLAFVRTQRPKDATFVNPQFQSFSRFLIDQDTGGAIKGKARGDLFFGEDEYAKTAAYNIRHRGELYFLILKP